MKILIFALPRTGSKFVANNIIKYLDDPTYQFHDLFNGDFKNHEIELVNNIPRSTDLELKTLDEFYENRIRIISQTKGTLVVKCHYTRLYERPDLIERMSELFDRVILIHRRDLFDHLLSYALSSIVNSWAPGEIQESVKIKTIAKPIVCDPFHWITMIEDFKKFQSIEFKDVKEVFVEDLYDSSNYEFCRLLNLPLKEFGLENDTKEFGVDKNKMIKNLDTLRTIFNNQRVIGKI